MNNKGGHQSAKLSENFKPDVEEKKEDHSKVEESFDE